MYSILVVDDEKSIRKGLQLTLAGKYKVQTVDSGSAAISLFRKEKPEAVLLDIGLLDMNGISVLKAIKEIDPRAQVIMVTALDDTKSIVEAVKLGAYDYLVKPINAQEVLLTIQNALQNKLLQEQIRCIQQPNVERYRHEFIGRDARINEMVETARKASKSMDTPVLIVGESGTGKGVLAKTIHYTSTEIPGPFVTVNCGAIVKDLVESELFGYEAGAFTGARAKGKQGRFEEAGGGTLLLDEIGAMPLAAQTKLLGVLEDRTFYRVGGTKEITVTARIIAATNTDLEKAVQDGEFRQDLYYRLNVIKIEVPPLRQRPDDIILLTEHFMSRLNNKLGKNFSKISDEARDLLLHYHWPGNVRELRNAIERILLLEDGAILRPEHLAFIIKPIENDLLSDNSSQKSQKFDYEEITKDLISEALKHARGNVQGAARLMNMPVHKLRYRISKFGLK